MKQAKGFDKLFNRYEIVLAQVTRVAAGLDLAGLELNRGILHGFTMNNRCSKIKRLAWLT